MASSSVAPEPAVLCNSLISHLQWPLYDARGLLPSLANASSSFFPLNSLYVGGFARPLARRRRSTARPGFSASIACGGSRGRGLWEEFNKFVRFHSGGLPLGFASIGIPDEAATGAAEGPGVLEDDGLGASAVELDRPKRVLILMSDTGGGHRASAEAIKAAFREEYGDEYQVGPPSLFFLHKGDGGGARAVLRHRIISLRASWGKGFPECS